MLTQKEKNVVISSVWTRYMDELRAALPELPPLGDGKRKHHKQTQQHKQKINSFKELILTIEQAEAADLHLLYFEEKAKEQEKQKQKLIEEMEALKTETNININNHPKHLAMVYPANQNITLNTKTNFFN